MRNVSEWQHTRPYFQCLLRPATTGVCCKDPMYVRTHARIVQTDTLSGHSAALQHHMLEGPNLQQMSVQHSLEWEHNHMNGYK